LNEKTQIRLTLQNREIILVGTAHVSRESIEEVQEVIRHEQPDMVCVELDSGRLASMTQQDSWEKLDLVKVFKEGKGFLLMANLVLASFQRRLGQNMGVKPGDEMKAAIATASELKTCLGELRVLEQEQTPGNRHFQRLYHRKN